MWKPAPNKPSRRASETYLLERSACPQWGLVGRLSHSTSHVAHVVGAWSPARDERTERTDGGEEGKCEGLPGDGTGGLYLVLMKVAKCFSCSLSDHRETKWH